MLIKERLFYFKRINKNINLNINVFKDINNFQIQGPLGKNSFNCSNQTLIVLKTFQNSFLLKRQKLKIFFNNFREAVRGVLVPWIRSFAITGYQYKIAYSYKKNILYLGLGFTYWILIDLTSNNIIYLKTIKGKLIKSISRKFILTSIDYNEFQFLQKYLNTVRNLLPYKLKGLTFPEKKIKLKKGKKVKYR